MAEHKFTYTVSGVTLTDDQKNKVSAAIGSAVALALAGGHTKQLKVDALNIGRINGGLWIDVAEAERIGIQNVLKSPAVTSAAGG